MSIYVRLFVVALLAFMGMALVANNALMTRAHIKPGCTLTHDGYGTTLEECHRGWFKGYPNLAGKGCTAVGVAARLQLWSCPRS